LLAEDTILDRPRAWVLRLGDWKKEGDPVPDGYRSGLGEFVQCPWCLGAWCSIVWWLAWGIDEKWALIVATPFAISALVGFARVHLDPAE
jgi:hypothetical protein